jgi:hypothetical protein
MVKTNIPETTLFALSWGKQYFESTLKSIICSKQNIEFDNTILATNVKDLSQYENILDTLNISILELDANLNDNLQNDDENRQKFSTLFLETLNKACKNEFILTIQQDSSIIRPELWNNEFLKYDYIGAPWPIEIIQSSDMVAGKIKDIKNTVGNGGFSLRSKKYLQLSLKMPFYHKNEDLNLCIFNYENMINQGIKLSPPSLAIQFSVEHPIPQLNVFDRNFLMTYNSFGFHGSFNKAGMEFITNNSRCIT